MQKIYDFKAFSSKGKEIDFSQFQGKVLLIVRSTKTRDSSSSASPATSSRSKILRAMHRLRSSAS